MAAGHLSVNERADVAIVGLGAMGALSAWHLASRGAAVIGIDRFAPGHDRGSSHGDTRIFRTAYFESPEYVPLLQRARVLWRQLENETGTDLLTLTGGLSVGPPDGDLVSGVLASARQNGISHRVLDASDMKRLYPQHVLADGEVAVLEEDAGFLRPEQSVAAAASRARALGARVMSETEAIAIVPSDGDVVIETSAGRVIAKHVIVAAGAWTPKLMSDLDLPLVVERQVMVWLAVQDPTEFAPESFPIFIREPSHGRFRYGFPTTDGRAIKLGVHHEGRRVDPDSIDREIRDEDLQPVVEFARDHLRGVSDEVVDARVCMYTNTPDESFIAISPSMLPNVTILSACSGHGFKFASVIGELMAGSILDGRALPAIIRTA
ncbi:MAG TPA: N-methyl-L-tryptophan oxidase [Candidatus Dormibacteraeota bacterium]|nr:N-methyl-L-tryptophan oxidase [Candidatus Dormibacteraeota bacterium]